MRVVDFSDRVGEAATRLLADLGADTIKIEPPGGASTRQDAPFHHGHSLGFAMRNANKRSAVLDLSVDDELTALQTIIAEADIAFLTPAVAESIRLSELVEHAPHLVVVVSSPFGLAGPRSHWQATERTLYALSGAMSRSGRPGSIPLLPPDGLADATAATQAAWTALVAYQLRKRSGSGQIIDLSHHEAVVTGLDPAFGVQGSAAAGRSGKFRRDRPPADSYPVFPCSDGYVRLCLLAKRQWLAMFTWLGEPGEFADPIYNSIVARVQAADRLDPLIARLFLNHTGAELVEEAARRGVPLAQVLSLGDALVSDHFTSAGTVAKAEIAPGLIASVPLGCVQMDGKRLGIRSPSPALAPRPQAPVWVSGHPDPSVKPSNTGSPELPFEGLRVLDLGVIVFGAELGRAFADLGADVIKVESLAFPDGLRQTRGGEEMNASFAWGQRNKRSLGLDIRTDEGHALFLDLARNSDVVVSNFKPGTLSTLGIDHLALLEVNPRIVVLESAAFSSTGPWARRLGYGPLVRAACGISSLWRYGPEDVECWDGVTVFPDHVAARVAAVSIAAALIGRDIDGRGRHIEVAQSDVVLHQLGGLAAWEALEPGSVEPAGNRGRDVFGGVFRCAGDDEWCVIEARTEIELTSIGRVIGSTQGSLRSADLRQRVGDWALSRTPHEAMEALQAAGVPAGAMLRLPELLNDPQLTSRSTYTVLKHPALDFELPTEAADAPYGWIPKLSLTPAPRVGEQTKAICTDVLGTSDDEYQDLVGRGVLHEGTSGTGQH